jgi:RND family efflux transporter MFP subunit
VIARLDPEAEQNGLRSAQAAHAAASAQLAEAQANFERQSQLLERGFTTRQRFDEAQRVLRGAESSVDSAAAQVEIARVRLEDTVLVADASGSVTARGAEPGEVVAAGRMIVQVARDGGRDAVFDVPPSLLTTAPTNPVVDVALTINPSVRTTGRVREVAPQADAQTGTFRVRVGLEAVPEAMRLGSTVTGSISIGAAGAISIPASALTAGEGGPAVWVVDPATSTVALRRVEVVRHGPGEVTIGGGIETGEIVVTAGVQALRPGQRVRLLGDA